METTKDDLNKAADIVRQLAFCQGGAGAIKCPLCGWASNGRILRGNFSGERDTRVPAVVRHIYKAHNKG